MRLELDQLSDNRNDFVCTPINMLFYRLFSFVFAIEDFLSSLRFRKETRFVTRQHPLLSLPLHCNHRLTTLSESRMQLPTCSLAPDAATVAVLHCLKYPSNPVFGLLLGRASATSIEVRSTPNQFIAIQHTSCCSRRSA